MPPWITRWRGRPGPSSPPCHPRGPEPMRKVSGWRADLPSGSAMEPVVPVSADPAPPGIRCARSLTPTLRFPSLLLTISALRKIHGCLHRENDRSRCNGRFSEVMSPPGAITGRLSPERSGRHYRPRSEGERRDRGQRTRARSADAHRQNPCQRLLADPLKTDAGAGEDSASQRADFTSTEDSPPLTALTSAPPSSQSATGRLRGPSGSAACHPRRRQPRGGPVLRWWTPGTLS